MDGSFTARSISSKPATKEALTITAPVPNQFEFGLKYRRKFAAWIFAPPPRAALTA